MQLYQIQRGGTAVTARSDYLARSKREFLYKPEVLLC